MRNYLMLLTLLASMSIVGCKQATPANESEAANYYLTAPEFAEKLKEMPNVQLIDVRTPMEYDGGHIQNAVNINIDGANFQAEVSKLDKSKPVMVYCLSGARSAAAARQMRAEGFSQVYDMAGGMLKWRAANLPETTEAPNQAQAQTPTTATSPAMASAKGLTKAQFEEMTRSEKTVLVDFYADWCAPCKKMEPYLKEIANDMSDKVQLVRINVDDNPQLAMELGIDAIPVIRVYKKNAMSWNNMGYIEKEEVLKQL